MEYEDTKDIVITTGPSISEAKKHREEFILLNTEGKPIPVCKSTPADLGSGGVGLEMYFVFLKELTLVFGAMTIPAIPLIVINYLGGYLNTVEKTSPFEGSTLANQQGTITDNRDNEEHKKNRAFMYVTIIFDLIYCAIYLAMIFIIECYNHRRVKMNKNTNVGDFAITIELVEGITASENELRGFFERYGAVHECIIPKYYGRVLKRYKKYVDIDKALTKEFKRTNVNNGEKINELIKIRSDILDDIKKDPDEDDGKLRAFIIFETVKAKFDCLNDYSKRWLVRKSDANLRRTNFKGTQSKVEQAPEPVEIFWENFGEKRYMWKRIVIYAVLAFTLLISLLLISIIEYYENRLPTYTMCIKQNYILGESRNDTSGLQTEDENQVLCFCGGLSENEITNNPAYSSFCQKYWRYFYGIWALRLLGMCVVSLINTLLKYTIMGILQIN